MKNNIGIIFILGHALCMGIINVLVAFVCAEVSIMQIIGFQFCIPFIILLPWLLRKGIKPLKTELLPVHVQRICMVIFALFFYYTSMQFLPFLNVVLVENSTPVLIPIISLIWLKERISFRLWFAMLVGLVGVYFTLSPHSLVFNLYVMFPVYSAFVSAYSAVSVKFLSRWGDTKEAILFYYFGIGTLISGPFLVANMHLCSWTDLAVFSMIGVLMAIAQLTLFFAYQYGMPGRLAPFAYSEIMFTALLGWALFQDQPEIETLVGMLCIIISGLVMLNWKEWVKQ
ncbi:MAG: DMT family transporter [Chlamydiae bacterium]|nr:DMT family transporter [Chlamydiota bacterium]